MAVCCAGNRLAGARWRVAVGAAGLCLLTTVQPATTLVGQSDVTGIAVNVISKHSTGWPCCDPGNAAVFASVVGAATPGYFEIDFDRPMQPREDLGWDRQFEIFDLQTLVLSSSADIAVPPTWARGFLVRSGGILSLTRLSMGGDVRVQATASLNMSGVVFSGRHSLYMEGGHIHIADSSELKALDGVVELGAIDSFSVLNSTVHMPATVAGDGPKDSSSILLFGTEFQRYSSWSEATGGAGMRRFVELTITLEDARSVEAGMPPGTILGTIQSENDNAVTCARTGWTGWDCLEDINECTTIVDEESVNGGCHQVCVNTPGSYYCGCRDGYRLIDGSETQCEDIDECALQGCLPGSLARDCRVTIATTAQDATGISRCQHFCTNFEGTFQCSCDPGLSLKGDDAYTCHDLDECMDEGVWGDPCIEIPHATCDNLVGSVQCLCDPGYEASDAGGDVLIVVRDGDVTIRNGAECSEVGVPEQP